MNAMKSSTRAMLRHSIACESLAIVIDHLSRAMTSFAVRTNRFTRRRAAANEARIALRFTPENSVPGENERERSPRRRHRLSVSHDRAEALVPGLLEDLLVGRHGPDVIAEELALTGSALVIFL